MYRRHILQFGYRFGVAVAAPMLLSKRLTGCAVAHSPADRTPSAMPINPPFFMPDEGDPHLRTWMAFGPSAEIWGREDLAAVQDDLAKIAGAIARYEPVKMLVRPSDYGVAVEKCGPAVELLKCPIDDLWIRDTGPIFVVNPAGEKAAVDFNFNGWGGKQAFERDAGVAEFVAQQAQVPLRRTHLVAEGGGIEVDGRGTALITKSCLLNDNRNPGLTQAECEAELKTLLGLEKIIWLPGMAGQDITDGHTDFYARFARPGVVVAGLETDPAALEYEVTQQHLDILRTATDATGQRLDVAVIEAPHRVRLGFDSDEFAAGYINFYVVNGAVIAPEFGDEPRDRRARETLGDLFPHREVVQLNIDNIAAGGGGIHCTTQQEPRTDT